MARVAGALHDGEAGTVIDSQAGKSSDKRKIAILMPNRNVVLDGYRSDQAVCRGPNGVSFPSPMAVDFCSLQKGSERKRVAQSGDGLEGLTKRLSQRALTKTLKNFLSDRTAGY